MTKQEAIAFFGSQHALARALGISQPSVANWKDPLPALRQLQIEMLSFGRLPADPHCKPKSPTQQAAAGTKRQMV